MSVYLDHFGLSEPPFRITPQTTWFYAGAQRGALLDALLYAIAHDEGIIKVSGEVGVGKTMLCRMLLERLPRDAQVIYIANPSLAPEALLQTIALELGISDTAPLTLLRHIEAALIERYAAGKRVVAIIDEAHAMPRESLEQVRLLSNLESASRKLLQLVLFGQTELDELLALREMRSLQDRITQHFSLGPLAEPDVAAYLRHRLDAAGYRGPDLFDKHCVRLITHASRGLTRRINILADKTLMAAFADKTRNVARKHVRAAAEDARYSLPPAKRIGVPLLIGGAALACTTLGVWAGMHFWPHQPPVAQVANIAAPASVPPAASAPQIPALPATASVVVATPAVQSSQSTPLTTDTNSLGPLTHELLEHSRKGIADAATAHFFIQLQRVSAVDAATLETFVQRARSSLDPAQLRLYSAKVDGRMRYGVIFGEYDSAKDATAAIGHLPDWVKVLGVYPRQYAAIKP